MAWTDERIARLKQGWESGMTATQIAEMLGEGVTRNAVIGKAHRLGLESRPSPVKATETAPAPQAAAPAAPPATPRQAAPAAPPAPSPISPAPQSAPPANAPAVARPAAKAGKGGKQARTSLLDLNEKVCKWPIGHPDDADFHFCGRPSQPGFPYCGEHCLVAYQAQMPRRDRPKHLPPLPGPPRR